MIRRYLPQLIIAVFLGPVARAEWLPAPAAGLTPPSIVVLSENDQSIQIADQLKGTGPIIVMPMFTHCAAVCPVMVRGLKRALAQKGVFSRFRVLLYDFDTADKAADLAKFRKEKQIPDSWVMVRSKSDQDTKDFFDHFNYRFMRSDGGFDHPVQMLTFSQRGSWSGTLYGNFYNQTSLAPAYAESLTLESPTVRSRLRKAITHADNWVLIGTVGFLLSFALILYIIFR